jgi:putative hydrolase of the HAD superfamily
MGGELMRTTALIFDLDETLVADQEATRRALIAAAQAERARFGLTVAPPEALADALWGAAERLWLAGPQVEYAQAIGMSSWEGLWARFSRDEPPIPALRAWAPEYRRNAWRAALAAQGATADALDDALLDGLQTAFASERRALHLPFPDALPALDRVRGRYRLALLTNGDTELQREKVAGANLGGYFDAIVASGDLGQGKPDPRIYAHTLHTLGASAEEAVMIGDSLRNDVWGAQRAGMRGVWLRRAAHEGKHEGRDTAGDADVRPDATIRSLAALDDVLQHRPLADRVP